MGIAYGALKFLFDEGKKERWHGKLLTLGKQDIAVTIDNLNRAALENSYVLGNPGKPLHSEKEADAIRGYLRDEWFFKALGFSSVRSMDMSGYEYADIIHDLNNPEPPPHCNEAYDLVLDGGTLEHVFHIPNALACVARMVRSGGRIIHISPMSNFADHGFYSFSPTLFVDYYSTNRFTIEKIVYIRFERDPCADPWFYYDYTGNSMANLEAGVYFMLACVRKLPNSTWDRLPQQGYYVRNGWRAE